MEQLIKMLSYVAHIPLCESEKLILATNTGKAILARNITVLYEHQTENLNCILDELDMKEYGMRKITTNEISDALNEIEPAATMAAYNTDEINLKEKTVFKKQPQAKKVLKKKYKDLNHLMINELKRKQRYENSLKNK